MTGDTILTVVVTGIVGVLAALITVSLAKRGETRADVATSARHEQQIAALAAALTQLREESHRQWIEVREWMARMSARMDSLDARLTRLEARLDERDRRGDEVREAIVRESLDEMREWCSTRCDVRREVESESGVRTMSSPRIQRYDGKVEP